MGSVLSKKGRKAKNQEVPKKEIPKSLVAVPLKRNEVREKNKWLAGQTSAKSSMKSTNNGSTVENNDSSRNKEAD